MIPFGSDWTIFEVLNTVRFEEFSFYFKIQKRKISANDVNGPRILGLDSRFTIPATEATVVATLSRARWCLEAMVSPLSLKDTPSLERPGIGA